MLHVVQGMLYIWQVDVPSLSGDFGILAQHVPTLAALKPGVVTVHDDEGPVKYFVSSGTVTVNSDSSVQILAEEATPLDRSVLAKHIVSLIFQMRK